ncbi:MAG TPA: response regulator, partial [Luteimonas sp.]|nr:response regulator [Luteimonas sp.]
MLIVEDEMILAIMLEDALQDAGYRVLKAGRLPKALALATSERIDAAILDINLAGKEVFPVADELRRRGIALMFTSGYGEDGLPAAYRDAPMLQKPYSLPAL